MKDWLRDSADEMKQYGDEKDQEVGSFHDNTKVTNSSHYNVETKTKKIKTS